MRNKMDTSELRYKVWSIKFILPSSKDLVDLDYVEYICKKSFTEYYVVDTTEQSVAKIYAVTKVRKRESTLVREISNFIDVIPDEDKPNPAYLVYLEPSKQNYSTLVSKHTIKASSEDLVYSGNDIKMLDDLSNWKEWELELSQYFYNFKKSKFLPATDRELIWVHCKHGLSGKSKFVKWFCVNHPHETAKISFGLSAAQLRAGMLSAGCRLCYFIDLPRTRSKNDDLSGLLSMAEDLLNGHISTCYGGSYKQLICDCCHLLIFSNDSCPVEKMSRDRWIRFRINKDDSLSKL